MEIEEAKMKIFISDISTADETVSAPLMGVVLDDDFGFAASSDSVAAVDFVGPVDSVVLAEAGTLLEVVLLCPDTIVSRHPEKLLWARLE